MRPPARRIRRAQQAVEMIGNGLADRLEFVRHDPERTPPLLRVHQSRDGRPRRRPGRMERELVLDLLDGRGRQALEHGEMSRHPIMLGRG